MKEKEEEGKEEGEKEGEKKKEVLSRNKSELNDSCRCVVKNLGGQGCPVAERSHSG